jgi:pyridoxamine 5'-phosphate oxidase
MDIGGLRREYRYAGLSRQALDPDPVLQFARWFEQAEQAGLLDPNAMVLATVSAAGQVSQRTVLLKYFDDDGFVFFTNLESKKAGEMAGNDRVSLLFPWLQFDRQVIVEGRAVRISQTDALRYFLTRPRDSQLAAWVSNQSQPLTSRQVLLQKFDEMKRKFADGKIPMPSFWGGYRVRHERVEFWQGREQRLHDRFQYARQGEGGAWSIERLAP